MASNVASVRISAATAALETVLRFLTQSAYARMAGQPSVCDFALGNPQEMPLPGFVRALGKWSVPRDKDWFAYKTSEPEPQALVAASLRQSRDLPFDESDILMTSGAFAGLSAALCALVDPGDEVIFISPPWFFYESMILTYGAVPVRVRVNPDTFDLDLDAIDAALTERTRAIIINSPNNPTGKIYPPATLRALAERLSAASQRNGRTIYLLSDEAYNRIVYDGRDYPSPLSFYPESLLIYTYGKTLLTPGQRIGYLALSPAIVERAAVREALFTAQLVVGFAFPNALLQHALPDLDQLSIDVGHLQEKRDRLVPALQRMGYDLHSPEGTFYLMVRAPLANDEAYAERLAAQNILVLPGAVVEMPGYFRLSLTASDDMIDRALPGFEAALREVEATLA